MCVTIASHLPYIYPISDQMYVNFSFVFPGLTGCGWNWSWDGDGGREMVWVFTRRATEGDGGGRDKVCRWSYKISTERLVTLCPEPQTKGTTVLFLHVTLVSGCNMKCGFWFSRKLWCGSTGCRLQRSQQWNELSTSAVSQWRVFEELHTAAEKYRLVIFVLH